MNKKDFLNTLSDKLYFLVDSEKDKELNKYNVLIDNYVNMGQTEDVVISSLGDINDLVTAIYLSHGLDYKKIYTGRMSFTGIKGSFKNFFGILSGNDKKGARNAILYFLYIILLVIILKIAFIFVRDIITQVFPDITSNKVVDKVYYLFFEITYVIAAIVLFLKLFTKKFSK